LNLRKATWRFLTAEIGDANLLPEERSCRQIKTAASAVVATTSASPGHRKQDVTWSDVESEIIARLRCTDLLDLYRQQLSAKQTRASNGCAARWR